MVISANEPAHEGCNTDAPQPRLSPAPTTAPYEALDPQSTLVDGSLPHENVPLLPLPPRASQDVAGPHITRNPVADTDASNDPTAAPGPDVENPGELALSAREWRWVATQRYLERISPVPIAWWPFQGPEERVWKVCQTFGRIKSTVQFNSNLFCFSNHLSGWWDRSQLTLLSPRPSMDTELALI